MRAAPLPKHLAAALGKGHAAKDVPLLIAQLEAHGVEVTVLRIQLGNPNTDAFGTRRQIYRSPERKMLDG